MIKSDYIVVVDVESTCWEGSPPSGQASEIIEVGICLLDKFTGEISKKDGIVVRPERSEVSEFCTTLTGWTQEQVDTLGIPFAEACKKIKKEYTGKGRVWSSWGEYDRKMFTNQCRDMKIDYPFTPQHLNAKQMVTFLSDNTRGLGLTEGLEFLGLQFEGRHHKGADDAYNVARALWAVRKKHIWNGTGGQ